MLGAKIRKRRTELGFNLQDIANRTGLTPSFISQVERDQVEPSISSLRKIAQALEVPIFYFLVDDSNHKMVTRSHERRVLELPGSGVRYELLSPADFAGRKMEVVVTRMAPGASSHDHPFTHPGEECIVVQRGRALIQVAGEEYVLEPGDSIYILASIPHRVSNAGDDELEILAAITPPAF